MSEQVYDILRRLFQTKLHRISYFKDPLKKKTNYSVSFIVEIQSNSAFFIQTNAGPLTGADRPDQSLQEPPY